LALDRALTLVRDGARRTKLINGLCDVVGKVNAGEAARLVLASRRMTDLYHLARNVPGVPDSFDLVNGVQVMGDRLLGLLPDGAWAADEFPTLAVDDVEITGATMDRLVDQCVRVVGSPDKVERHPFLTIIDNSANKKAIANLHRGFARTFGQHVVPYATDFVMSKEFKLAPGEMLSLLEDREWRAVDVTGAHAADMQVWSCSLFPVGDLRRRFLEELGEASKLVQVVKIRLFFAGTLDKYTARVVPMVLTRGLPAAGLAQWLKNRHLAEGRESDPQALISAATLVSMVLSSGLFKHFAAHVADKGMLSGRRRPAIKQDWEFVELAAGSEFAEVVKRRDISGLKCLTQGTDEGWLEKAPAAGGGPGDLFLWPREPRRRSKPDRGGHYVHLGDDAVKPVLTAIGKQAASAKKDQSEDPGLSLVGLADAVSGSVGATSATLDVLNDNGSAVAKNRQPMEGEAVERRVLAAEVVTRYQDFPMCQGGGRLTVGLTTDEAARHTSDDSPT
jgi:hypothetical protein